jgi:hypothetical protein
VISLNNLPDQFSSSLAGVQFNHFVRIFRPASCSSIQARGCKLTERIVDMFGHTGIIGNEEADRLADAEAKTPSQPTRLANQPTASGIRTVAKALLKHARNIWWESKKATLSTWYNQWNLPYITTTTPPELELPQPTLARLLAIRSTHGDYAWYHTKFKHEDAKMKCSCGCLKTPGHLVHCRKPTTSRVFHKWPNRPIYPPNSEYEGKQYLAYLLSHPQEFEAFLKHTEFYTAICSR